MKIWPIITLGALIYGSFYADSQNIGRESAPHPRPHRSALDTEVEALFPTMPHRVATIAFASFFKQILQETDWTVKDKVIAETAADDADDGEDPGKKLFWRTNFGPIDPIPFPGWGDPNPISDPGYVALPFQGDRHVPEVYYYIIIEDPAPPRQDENFATIAATKLLQLPFGALAALNELTPAPDSDLIKTLQQQHHHHHHTVNPSNSINPSDPITPIFPVVTGGGGVGASTVPETSTWILVIIGFALLSLLRAFRDVRSVGPNPPSNESTGQRPGLES